MNYEEKYKEALERARALYAKNAPDSMHLESIFPELKESEDERMRRQTLKILNYYKDEEKSEGRMPTEINECITWLENQCEHNMGISEATKQKLEDNLNKALEKETPESYNEFLDEQNPAEHKEIPTDIRSIVDKEANAIWKEINTGHNHSIIDTFNQFYGICMQVAEDVMEYNKPVEWSEEDKHNLNSVINLVHNTRDGAWGSCVGERIESWLKSLKARYTWKPSDEQMKLLREVLNFAANYESPHWNDYIFGTLNNLIRQLKKLKG